MQMTKSEILREYNLAKNPKDQIQVLADLNATDKQTIVDILIEMGVDGRTLPHPRRPKKEKPAENYMQSAAEHLEVLMTALQLYKQNLMDGLEAEVDRIGALCTKIDNALAYVKEMRQR